MLTGGQANHCCILGVIDSGWQYMAKFGRLEMKRGHGYQPSPLVSRLSIR
jgi:hypothetical protein